MLMKHNLDHGVVRKQAGDSVEKQDQFSAKMLPPVLAGVQASAAEPAPTPEAVEPGLDEALVAAEPDGRLERIQVYWAYPQFAMLPAPARAELVASLAEMIGVESQAGPPPLVYLDQTALDWPVSPAAVENLRRLVGSNASSLQILPLDTLLLEQKNGEIEAWYVSEQGWQCRQPADGSKILSLLDRGFEPALLLETLQATYPHVRYLALRQPEEAARLCQAAIDQLDPVRYLGRLSSAAFSSDSLAGLMQPRYSRGLFHLLLASIKLNQGLDFRQVEEHYLIGRDEFLASGQFFYLALADLGQAIALRQRGELEDARDVCWRAHDLLQHESRPGPATLALRQAVEEEVTRLEAQMVIETLLPAGKKAVLNVFNVGTGARLAAQRGNAGLHFFSRKDYEAAEPPPRQAFSFELERLASQTGVDIGAVTYILEIPPGFSTDGSLQPGDWVLIAGEVEPERLHHKRVVVLEDDILRASLKTFFNEAHDHFFLKAAHEAGTSFVVENYGASAEAIEKYYQKYKKSGPVEYRAAYEVCLSGLVVGIIRRGELLPSALEPGDERQSPPVIRPLPVVAHLSAGLSEIEPAAVTEEWYLREPACAGATFGLIVDEACISEAGLEAGDLVLIRQQAAVEPGELAAVVIRTPDQTIEAIKVYHVFERPGREHWFLRSSGETGPHLVAIPAGSDPAAVKRLYHRRLANVAFLTEAEVWIAGKYVKKISAAKAR